MSDRKRKVCSTFNETFAIGVKNTHCTRCEETLKFCSCTHSKRKRTQTAKAKAAKAAEATKDAENGMQTKRKHPQQSKKSKRAKQEALPEEMPEVLPITLLDVLLNAMPEVLMEVLQAAMLESAPLPELSVDDVLTQIAAANQENVLPSKEDVQDDLLYFLTRLL